MFLSASTHHEERSSSKLGPKCSANSAMSPPDRTLQVPRSESGHWEGSLGDNEGAAHVGQPVVASAAHCGGDVKVARRQRADATTYRYSSTLRHPLEKDPSTTFTSTTVPLHLFHTWSPFFYSGRESTSPAHKRPFRDQAPRLVEATSDSEHPPTYITTHHHNELRSQEAHLEGRCIVRHEAVDAS